MNLRVRIRFLNFEFFWGRPGHPGKDRGTQGKARGPPGSPGSPFPGFPLGPPGHPWVPLASKKEKMGSTFNERRVASEKPWCPAAELKADLQKQQPQLINLGCAYLGPQKKENIYTLLLFFCFFGFFFRPFFRSVFSFFSDPFISSH